MPRNERNSNGARRRNLRERVRAQGLPCHLCGYPIDYGLPAGHSECYELDEIRPISKWMRYGYASASQCATDPDNVAPAHRCCNQWRGNMELTDALRAEIRARYEAAQARKASCGGRQRTAVRW